MPRRPRRCEPASTGGIRETCSAGVRRRPPSRSGDTADQLAAQYRQSAYVCIIDGFGGYGCPTNAEGSPPLRRPNATANERGVLKLDVPLEGTHPTPPLAWQRRYPHTDGWIEPWARTGALRAGLKLARSRRGSCSRGSFQTKATTAGRCLPLSGVGIFDPCFRDTTAGGVSARSSPVAPGPALRPSAGS